MCSYSSDASVCRQHVKRMIQMIVFAENIKTMIDLDIIHTST